VATGGLHPATRFTTAPTSAPSQREGSTVRVQEKFSSAIWPRAGRVRIGAAPAGRVPGGQGRVVLALTAVCAAPRLPGCPVLCLCPVRRWSGSGHLTGLFALAAGGRLDGQVELQCSWRQPEPAIDALLNRRTGGRAVLHVD
jgi:hypothetical protein